MGRPGFDRHLAGGDGAGPGEVVAGQQDRPSPRRGVAHQLVDEVAAFRVEPGVRLVEQPQLGVAGDEARQRAPAPLPGAQTADRHVAEAPVEAHPLEGGLDRTRRAAPGAYGEADVVGNREVVVEGGGVTDQAQQPADRSTVDPQVVPQDHGGAVDDGHQPGAGAQQGGLASAVRPGQEHDLADPDVEVDARKGGEASEQADGGAEVDGEAHASGPRVPAGRSVPPRRPGFSSAFRKGLDAGGTAPARPGRKGRGQDRQPDPDEVAATALAGASAQAAATTVEPAPAPPPPPRRVDLASVLSVAGRTLITLGVLVLGFVAFELLGTNVAEARNQSALREQLNVAPPPADLPVSAPIPDQPAPPPPPAGSAVARMRIPRIGVDKAVVEGVDLADLRRGPGHYANTPLPGQPGNSAIAGHRTTYGAPFFRLDQLEAGDPIFVTTVQGAFRYEVTRVFVVKPEQIDVLEPTAGDQLTLTTCHPRFSAAQRLVVTADLKGPAAAPAPPAPRVNPNPAVAASEAPPIAQEVVGASGDPSERIPAALWGTVVLALGIAGSVLGRLWRRWPARLLMAAPVLVSVWTFYTHLARAVPS